MDPCLAALGRAETAANVKDFASWRAACVEATAVAPAPEVACACLVEAASASSSACWDDSSGEARRLVEEATSRSQALPAEIRGGLYAWMALLVAREEEAGSQGRPRPDPRVTATGSRRRTSVPQAAKRAVDLLSKAQPTRDRPAWGVELQCVVLGLLARRAKKRERLGDAKTAARQGVECATDRTWKQAFLLFLAGLERADGNLDAAERALSDALALDPDAPEVRCEWARLCLVRKRFDDALRILRPQDHTPDPRYAIALLLAQRPSEAQTEFERLLPSATEVEQVQFLIALAICHKQQGHTELSRQARARARTVFREADLDGVVDDDLMRAQSAAGLDRAAEWIDVAQLPDLEYHNPSRLGGELAVRTWMSVAPRDTHTAVLGLAFVDAPTDITACARVVDVGSGLLATAHLSHAQRIGLLARLAKVGSHADLDVARRHAWQWVDMLHDAAQAPDPALWTLISETIGCASRLWPGAHDSAWPWLERISSLIHRWEVPTPVRDGLLRAQAASMSRNDPKRALQLLTQCDTPGEADPGARFAFLSQVARLAERADDIQARTTAEAELARMRHEKISAHIQREAEPDLADVFRKLEPYLEITSWEHGCRFRALPTSVLLQIAPAIEEHFPGFSTCQLNAQVPLHDILSATAPFADRTTFDLDFSGDPRVDTVDTVSSEAVRAWRRNADEFREYDDGTVHVWWD